MASRKPNLDRILRDKFAMEAMKILINITYGEAQSNSHHKLKAERVAIESFSIANNMMKYRDNKN